MPHAHTAPGLDRLTTLLLLAFVAAVQLSIAAAQILLGRPAPLLDRRDWCASGAVPTAPTFFVALLAYAGVTLISSVVFARPARELHRRSATAALPDRALPCTTSRAASSATTVIDVIITVGAAAAVYGIVQYGCCTSTASASGREARSGTT